MKTSNRDKLILTILPAALIGLGWWFWFRPTAQWDELQNSVVATRQAVPPPGALDAQNKKLGELTAQHARLQQQQQTGLAHWDELRRSRQVGGHHAESMRQLTDILRRHELTPLKEERTESGRELTNDGTLGKVVARLQRSPQELIPELAAANKAANAAHPAAPAPSANSLETEFGPRGSTDRVMWQIEFAGSYPDVLAALEELSRSDLTMIPVRLLMAKSKTDISLRRWTLVVWL